MSYPILNSILVKSEDMVKQNMRVCRGCLDENCELYNIFEKRLELVFEELTGLPISGGLLCCICLRLLRKFNVFRWRCRNANDILLQFQSANKHAFNSTDRQHLKYNLEKTKASLIDIVPDTQNPDLDTVGTLQTDTPVVYDVPVLAENDIFVKTKLEEENDDPTTIIGEFITKDDIEDIKDVHVEPEFIEQNDDDFMWSDDDDKTLLENFTLTKTKIKKKGRKVDIAKKKTKVKKEKKETKEETRKIKKNKSESKRKKEKPPISDEIESDSQKPNKKDQPEDLILSTKIAATLRGIWKKNRNKDLYQLFERIYAESLTAKIGENSCRTAGDKSSCGSINDEDVSNKKKIRNFLDLVQKLSELYNVDTEFVRLEDLRKEMEEKRNSGKYNVAEHGCILCCKQYNFLDTYQRHMMRNHNNTWPIECDICRYRFKTQRDFLSHIMMHARIIKCRECGVSIPSKWCNAKKHAESHRGVVHACTLCNQTFTRKKSLSMHVRARHREAMEAVMCLLCGDTYNGDEGLKIHIRCMHKQAVQCESCLVWFQSEQALATHTQPAAGGCLPHHSSCPVCGGNFSNADTMLEHHKELHPMYKCAQCKTTFDSKKTCIHFKYNHNLVKGKTKMQKKRIRFYNKDIICEVCGKNNFTCVATLKIHQRIHTGERPFTCEICQKTFRMRSDLKLHTAIHTGERSYKCPYCPRTFRQPPHLKSHLPTHTKEKAHVCEICHKRFTQRANMQEHVRTIHEGLPPKRRQRHSKIFEA